MIFFILFYDNYIPYIKPKSVSKNTFDEQIKKQQQITAYFLII